MAIKLPDGRIMRTLPEQVDKNMQDIASINNEVNVIKESITTAYKIKGSATVADLNANTPDAAMNGYVYNMTDAGSLINSDESTTSVQIGDNVVLVWNDGNYFWDRLSGVVDTSNLVTLDSAQEITGEKSFTKNIKIGDRYIGFNGTYFTVRQIGNTNDCILVGDTVMYVRELKPAVSNLYNCGTSSNAWKDLYLSGKANIGVFSIDNIDANEIRLSKNNTSFVRIQNNLIMPYTTNNVDLGNTSHTWRDIYLARNLTDGTNSVTVAEIIKKRLTVSYNVSAAASSGISSINLTLSADDLAKLDSTKPLIIANNSTSAAVISAVYLPALNLFTVLAYQTQGNTSLDFDIYQ